MKRIVKTFVKTKNNRAQSKMVSLILAAVMIVGLLPSFTLLVNAADSNPWTSYAQAFDTSSGQGGTAANPIIIDSAQKLAYLAQQVNAGNTYTDQFFKQTVDIDIGAHQWVPIGIDNTLRFSGFYDGNRKSINNLTILNPTMANIGLFGYINSGTNYAISNLTLNNVSITGNSTTSSATNAASLVAVANGNFTNCNSNGTISLTKTVGTSINAGGLFSEILYGTVSLCFTNVNVTCAGSNSSTWGNVCAGGFAEYITANILNCYSTGNVRSSSANNWQVRGAGFVTSTYGGTISNCYSLGNVNATLSKGNTEQSFLTTYVGGFISFISSTTKVSNCYCVGDVVVGNTNNATGGNENYNGRFIGYIGSYTNATLSNCFYNSNATYTLNSVAFSLSIGGQAANGTYTGSPSGVTSANLKNYKDTLNAWVSSPTVLAPSGFSYARWDKTSGVNSDYPYLLFITPITATLTAPTSLIYDGNQKTYTANISGGTPALGTDYNITYTSTGGYNSTTAPTNAGSYTATFGLTTTGAQTYTIASPPSVNFTITKADPTGVSLSASPTSPTTYPQTVTLSSTVSSGSTIPTGTVTFYNDGSILGTGTLNASGTATYAWTPNVNAYTNIYATYNGDGNFNAKTSSSISYTVNKATPSTSDLTYNFSTPVTYTGSAQAVSVTSGKTGFGTITVYYNGSTTPPTNAGTYTITVDIKNGTNYNDVTGLNLGNYTISKVTPTISGAASFLKTYGDSSFNLGESTNNTDSSALSYSVVSGTSVTVNSSGNVTIVGIGTTTINVSAVATTNYNAPTVKTITVSVIKSTPIVSLSSSINPSTYEGSVTFTATVNKAVAGVIPTGTVQFKNGASNLGATVALDASGVAKYTTSALNAGANSITAVYNADSNYNTNTSTVLSQVVNQKPVTFTITGNRQAFDTNVKNINITSTGTNLTASDFTVSYYPFDLDTNKVNFTAPVNNPRNWGKYLYVVDFKSSQPNYSISNKATINTALTAADVPSGDNVGVMEIFYQAAPTKSDVTVTMNTPTGVAYGSNLSLSATVTKQGGTDNPTGTVTFLSGTDVIGTANVNVSGVATTMWYKPNGGTYANITAIYNGDSNFKTGASSVVSVVVSTAVQTVSASDITKTYGDATFNLTATTNGDGAITYAALSGSDVVTVTSNGVATIKKQGVAIIRVTAAATSNYNGATCDIKITVRPANAVVWASNTTAQFDGAEKGITVLSYPSIDTAVKYYKIINGVADTNDTTPIDVGVYQYVITTDNTNYTIQAGSDKGTFEISSAAQAPLAFEKSLVNATFDDTNVKQAVTGGNVITYSSSDETIAKVANDGTITIVKPGTVMINAVGKKTGYLDASASYMLNIAKKNITVKAKNYAKTYGDIDSDPAFSDLEISGTVLGVNLDADGLTFAKNYSTFSPANGTYSITPYGLTSDYYNISYVSGSMTINKRKVDVSANIEKYYDGKSTASFTDLVFTKVLDDPATGIVNNDIIKGSATIGSYSSTNAGNQTATLSNITIEVGSDNYILNSISKAVNVTINKAPVNFIGSNGVYYFDTSAKTAMVMAYSAITGEMVSEDNYEVQYNSATTLPTEVGVYTVTAKAKDSSNYTGSMTSADNIKLEIKPTAQSKLTINGVPSTAMHYGDPSIMISTTGGNGEGAVTYAVTAGNAVSVDGNIVNILGVGEVTITAIKAAQGGYAQQTTTATFMVLPKELTIDGSVLTKNYDGTITATITGSLKGAILADGIALASSSVQGSFADKNVGIGKSVNLTTDFALASNPNNSKYKLIQPPNLYGNITHASVTIGDAYVVAKDYDGNTNANAVVTTITGNVDGDNLQMIASAYFTNVNKGTHNVNVVPISLTGIESSNYKITDTTPYVTMGTIYQAPISVSIESKEVTYDGNPKWVDYNVSLMSDGTPVSNNAVRLIYTKEGVGYQKPTEVGVYIVTAELADIDGNYEFASKKSMLTLTILPSNQLPLAVNGVPTNVYYGDTFTVSTIGGAGGGTVKYAITTGTDIASVDENTGVVSITGVGPVVITATKTNPNFADQVATAAFTAQKRIVSTTAAPINDSQEYNGNTAVNVTIAISNSVDGTLTATGNGAMITPDAGADKLVHVTGIALSGANSDKYVLANTFAQTKVDVTPKEITSTIVSPQNKAYDTTTKATVTVVPNGIIGTDDVYAVTTASFDSADVAYSGAEVIDQTVTYSFVLLGTKAGNYVSTDNSGTTTAKITPAEVTFKSSDSVYVYDNNAHQAVVSAIVKETGAIFAASEYTVLYDGIDMQPINAKQYDVTVQVTNKNYFGNLPITKLTISPAEQIAFAINGIPNNVIEYGDSFPITLIGGKGDGEVTFTATNASVNAGTVTITGVGDVIITATKAAQGNYKEQVVSVAFKAEKKTVSFTIDDTNAAYNGENKKVTVSATDSAATFTVTGDNVANAGTYPVSVTVSGASADLYRGSVSATLTIAKAATTAQIITQDSQTYGTALSLPQVKVNGNEQLITGSSNAISGIGTVTITYTGANLIGEQSTMPTDAGEYTVIAKVIGDVNHEDSIATKAFTISKKKLTVTSDGQTKKYGEVNPQLTVQYKGFEYGDNESKLLVKPIATTTATTLSPVGEYAIIPSGGVDTNYEFEYVNSKLTIATAESNVPLYITGIPNGTIYYGDTFTLYANGGNGDGAYSFIIDTPSTLTQVVDGTFKVIGVGDIKVTLQKAADSKDNYHVQTTVTQVTSKAKKISVLANADLATRTYNTSTAIDSSKIALAFDSYKVNESDDLSLSSSYTAQMLTADAGDRKIVKVNGISLQGADADKYELVSSTVEAVVTIRKADDAIALQQIPQKTYLDSGFPIIITNNGIGTGIITYTSDNLSVATVTTDGKVYITGVGTANIIASKYADTNYNGTTASANIKVVAKPVTFAISDTQKQYNGNYQFATVGTNLSNLIRDVDYKVEYQQNGINITPNQVGSYDIIVTMLNKNYSGSKTGIFTIYESNQLPLSINGVPTNVHYGDTFSVTTIGGSEGGTVNYTLSGAVLEQAASGTFKAVGTGEVTITARKTSPNFTDQVATATFTVSQKVISASATAKDDVYNGFNSVIINEFNLAGVIGSDDVSVSATGYTAQMLNSDAGNEKTVKVNNISLTGTKASNYMLMSINIETTVNISPIIIDELTVKAMSKTYDTTTNATITSVNSSKILDGDKTAVVILGGGQFNSANVTEANSVVFIPTGLAGSRALNYVLANNLTGTAIASISQATVKFASSNDTYVYDGNEHKAMISATVQNTGAPFTSYTVSYKGITNNETMAQNVDTYDVSVTITDNNYTGTFPATTLKICLANQTSLTINGIPNNQVQYKDTFTLSAIGGSGNGGISYKVIDGNDVATVHETTGEVAVIGVGSVTIEATKASDENYNEQKAVFTITTHKKKLNLIVPTTNTVYNGYEQDITVLTDDADFVVNKTIDNRTLLDENSVVASYLEIADQTNKVARNVGLYQAIVKVADSNPYYTSDNATGMMNISKAPITITADNKEKTYGEENPKFNLTYTLLGTDADSDVTLPQITCHADEKSPVGEYIIALNGTDISKNYAATLVNGTLKVNKAHLTITAENKEKNYSRPNPQGTVVYSGFIDGDNETCLSGTLVYVFGNITDGVATETADTSYDIEVSGVSSNNYDISFVKGSLTVNPMPIAVTAGSAREGYIKFSLNEAIAGLQTSDISVTKNGLPVAITNLTSSSGNQSYTVAGTFEVGTKYQLNITKPNYTFNAIEVTPTKTSSGGGGGSASVTIHYTASYTAAEGGSVTGTNSQKLTANSTTNQVVAVANEGYRFVKWSDGVTTESRTDKLKSDITVTAIFEKIEPIEPEVPTDSGKPDEPEASEQTVSFTDTKGHWAEDDIIYVVKVGIFSGTSEATFSPDESITRGMFVTVLGRLAKEDTSHSNAAFTDVDENAYYAPFVAWAAENSIVKGVGEDKFEADRIITREEMSAVIHRFITYAGYDLELQNNMQEFIDASDIGDWAKDSVDYIKKSGIINGNENNEFRPKDTATRAEVAAIICRILKCI